MGAGNKSGASGGPPSGGLSKSTWGGTNPSSSRAGMGGFGGGPGGGGFFGGGPGGGGFFGGGPGGGGPGPGGWAPQQNWGPPQAPQYGPPGQPGYEFNPLTGESLFEAPEATPEQRMTWAMSQTGLPEDEQHAMRQWAMGQGPGDYSQQFGESEFSPGSMRSAARGSYQSAGEQYGSAADAWREAQNKWYSSDYADQRYDPYTGEAQFEAPEATEQDRMAWAEAQTDLPALHQFQRRLWATGQGQQDFSEQFGESEFSPGAAGTQARDDFASAQEQWQQANKNWGGAQGDWYGNYGGPSGYGPPPPQYGYGMPQYGYGGLGSLFGFRNGGLIERARGYRNGGLINPIRGYQRGGMVRPRMPIRGYQSGGVAGGMPGPTAMKDPVKLGMPGGKGGGGTPGGRERLIWKGGMPGGKGGGGAPGAGFGRGLSRRGVVPEARQLQRDRVFGQQRTPSPGMSQGGPGVDSAFREEYDRRRQGAMQQQPGGGGSWGRVEGRFDPTSTNPYGDQRDWASNPYTQAEAERAAAQQRGGLHPDWLARYPGSDQQQPVGLQPPQMQAPVAPSMAPQPAVPGSALAEFRRRLAAKKQGQSGSQEFLRRREFMNQARPGMNQASSGMNRAGRGGGRRRGARRGFQEGGIVGAPGGDVAGSPEGGGDLFAGLTGLFDYGNVSDIDRSQPRRLPRDRDGNLVPTALNPAYGSMPPGMVERPGEEHIWTQDADEGLGLSEDRNGIPTGPPPGSNVKTSFQVDPLDAESYRHQYETTGFNPQGGWESVFGTANMLPTYALGHPEGDVSWMVPQDWTNAGATYNYVAGMPGSRTGSPGLGTRRWQGRPGRPAVESGWSGPGITPRPGDISQRGARPSPGRARSLAESIIQNIWEGGGTQPYLSDEDEEGRAEWDRGFQEGGIVDAMPPGPGGMPPMPQMPEMPEMLQMPPGGELEVGAEISVPGGTEMVEEVAGPGGGEEEMMAVFSDAKDALEGNHPNPEEAIRRFVEAFGPDALQKMMSIMGVGEEMIAASDGMSDSIPGNIDGGEQVALSEGEYVVPADAVSHLGNGSTEAGGRRMNEMVSEIRRARTGNGGVPGQIDPRGMLG